MEEGAQTCLTSTTCHLVLRGLPSHSKQLLSAPDGLLNTPAHPGPTPPCCSATVVTCKAFSDLGFPLRHLLPPRSLCLLLGSGLSLWISAYMLDPGAN